MYFIAYKNLFRRKLRTFLAAGGVSIGVLLLVVIISVMLGISSMMDEFTQAMVGEIGLLEKGQMDVMSEIDKDYERTISRIPGIVSTAPRVYAFVKLEDVELMPLSGMIDEGLVESLPEQFREMMGGVRLVGIDPQKEREFDDYPTDIVKGTLFSKGDFGVCVLGLVLAEEANFDIGDRITVVHDRDNDGVNPRDKHDFKVVGIFETGSQLVDSNMIVNLEDAQKIKGLRSYKISRIDIKTDPGMEDEVIRNIKILIPGVDVMDPGLAMDMMNRFTSNMNLMAVLMIGFCGAIAFVFILIVMITSVMERTKEIGVLRATGWYKSDVLKLILVESVLLATIGTFMGTVFGVGALILVHEIFPGVQVIITPFLIGIVIIFGLLVGSLAGIYPAYRAASLSPLEAFIAGE